MKYIYDKNNKIVATTSEENVDSILLANKDQELFVADSDEGLVYFTEPTEEEKERARINSLRNQRVSILEAFDKYKANVYYGIEVETEDTKATILKWYKNLLDLKESAFENIPSQVKYYM